MPICSYPGSPILSQSVAIKMGIESDYGVSSPYLSELPYFYGDLSPIQPGSVAGARRISHESTTETIAIGKFFTLAGVFQVSGSGDATTPPKWMELFDICGLPRTYKEEDTSIISYRPGPTKFATFEVYYSDIKHTMLGSCGSLSFGARAGGPVGGLYRVQGLFGDIEAADRFNPIVQPLNPLLATGIGFTVIPESDTNGIDVIVKSFNIDLGRNIVQRYESNGSGNPSKIFLQSGVDVIWETIVEVNSGIDWIDLWGSNTRFDLSMELGSDIGNRIKCFTPDGFTAKLDAIPAYADVDGIKSMNLRFKLLTNNHIEIRHS